MSEDKILSKIMDKIDDIEVQTKLNQDAIINAINGVFLSRGIRLLYLSYDENTHGWLYFEDSFLVAAYTETSSALESLKEILSFYLLR